MVAPECGESRCPLSPGVLNVNSGLRVARNSQRLSVHPIPPPRAQTPESEPRFSL